MSAGMPSPGLSRLQTIIWAVVTILVGVVALLSLVLLWSSIGQEDYRHRLTQNRQTMPVPEGWRTPGQYQRSEQPRKKDTPLSEDIPPPWMFPSHSIRGLPRVR